VHEIRFILRSLIRTPLFTVTAVLSLALGIGANTAMFSLIDRVLLQQLPVKEPHRLTFLYHPGPLQGSSSTDEDGGPSFSYPMFREMQRDQTAFQALAGSRGAQASLSYRNHALPGSAHLVSGNYFSVLGVEPAIGRLFTEDDDRLPGGHPVVVLSHGYWVSRFGADPSVLNETMVVNGHPMTIVGVAQRGFSGEMPGRARDVFVPIAMKREMTPGWDGLEDRLDAWVTMVARLKPGGTFEQASAAIDVTYRAQLAQDEALFKSPGAEFLERFRAKRMVLRPGDYGRGDMREEGRVPLLLLTGMTLLVLLIACANVANLQLARASGKTREIALRLALGASRRQIVRRLLTESVIVAVAGGALGLIVARWTLQGIEASLPPEAAASGIVPGSLDGTVLAFSVALSVATGILFGLYPALNASRPDVQASLKDQGGQTSASRAAGFFRASLVTMQVAMSFLLLITAALFARTLVNLTRVDLGLAPDHLLTFALNPRLNGYTSERTAQLYAQLTERLAAVPGVTLVSAARVPAIAGSSSSTNVTVEGFTPQSDRDAIANFNTIGPGYFRTLGIPLVAGREFTESDNTPAAPRYAIVNEAFVRRFFEGESAIGRRMMRGGGPNATPDRIIVGVVKDAKYSDLRQPAPPVFYTPWAQDESVSSMHLYVRTGIAPEAAIEPIRRQVAALDPNLPIGNLRTMEAHLETRLSRERLLSRLTGIFGGLATLLAAIGLYGVLAYSVQRRTREIGIRIALGARTGHVRRLVVRDVAIMLVVGLVAGGAAAAGLGTLLRGVLFGVEPLDPGVYAVATFALGFVAGAAAYLPARRATSVDPLVALRCE